MNIEKIIESFKKNFATAEGAYSYLLINSIREQINSGASQEEVHKSVVDGLAKIAPEMPSHYTAFGKSVCDIQMSVKNKKELNKNQFYAFAEINDKYLDMDDYSSSKLEMIARSFEKFVSDMANSNDESIKKLLSTELSEKEKKNLLKIVENSYNSDFFPQGEVSIKLNEYWYKSIPEISKSLIENTTESNSMKRTSINNVVSFLKKRNEEAAKESSENIGRKIS